MHQGVYLAGALEPPPLARETAALLACPGTALVSHAAAARLHGLSPGGPATPIDVTVVAGDRRRGRRGLGIHVVDEIDPRDRARVHGLPVTAPARTLADLAGLLPLADLERLLEEALVLRLLRASDLDEIAARRAGRPGIPALRRAAGRLAEPSLTRSEAERALLALLRRAGLPHPRTNVRVGRHEVDCLWPAARLVVEVDGFAFHRTRAAFERDRRRDADLQAAGWRVVRVTWRQLTEEREALVALLTRLLHP
jgi:very-short-patch-repair endonuclease